MYKHLLAGLSLAMAVAAAPKASLHRREPSDKSGSVQIALNCDSTIIPNPGGAQGEGEGGTGLFSSNLVLTKDGETVDGENCEEDDGFCTSCDLTGPDMDTIRVQGCNNPMGGEGACNVYFTYKDYDYDSSAGQDYCGHTSSFHAFGDTSTGICYFDP